MIGPAGSPIDYKSLVERDRIHASLYREPRIFEDEMERIFHRGWVFVGHDSEFRRQETSSRGPWAPSPSSSRGPAITRWWCC
jgi:hypothetical protein